jgi:hypothetical protein
MVRADVVKDARDRPTHPIIESLSRVCMDGATCIFAFGVPDSIVGSEGFTDRDEGFPFIAHQVSRLVDGVAQHPAGLTLRKIVNHPSSGLSGWCAVMKVLWPLNNREHRRFRSSRLPLAATTQAGPIGVPTRSPSDIELIDLDRAAELLFARHQQSQDMTYAPGRRLADADRLGQAHGRYALVGLQDEPQTSQPDPQWQLR